MRTMTRALAVTCSTGFLMACGGGAPEPAAPVATVAAAPAPPPPTFQANPAGSDELKADMKKMLAAMDAGDVDGVVNMMAPESDELPSYTLGVDGRPVKYANVEDAKKVTREAMAAMKKSGAKVRTEVQSMQCQAASTLAVCAIELERNVQFPDAKNVAFAGRATAAARKGADGWKWTHWHMSYAEMPESLGPATPEVAVAGDSKDQKDLKWQEMPGMGGAQMAQVWSNPRTKATAVFTKAPKGFNVPRHFHSSPVHIVVLEGDLTITEEGGQPHVLKAGSWGLEPAKTIHTTTSKKGALAFMVSLAPFDQVYVDEKGNPLPAGTAPPGKSDEKKEKAEPAAAPKKAEPAPAPKK
jgi:quercetin dioxygenase-like cupin family protein/ketosteroid isomerase-like protein